MNWIEIGKNRENLPKDGELVVLAYLDQASKLKYTIVKGCEDYYCLGMPVLTSYDSGAVIYGTYIAYAGPLPQLDYNPMYDFAKKLFKFSERDEA